MKNECINQIDNKVKLIETNISSFKLKSVNYLSKQFNNN